MGDDYKSMISAAYEHNRKQHERWNNNIKLYKGEVTEFRKLKLRSWAHLIEVNIVRPTIDTMLPSLIFRTPKVNIRPAKEISDQMIVEQALAVENQINAIQVELDMGEEFVYATKDALLTGVGYVRYGLTTDFAFDDDDYAFPAPSIRRWSPWDVWPDPVTRDPWLRDAGYICFRYFVPIDQAKKDKTLKNKDKIQAAGIIEAMPTHLKENLDKNKLSGEYCEFVEVWDRRGGVIKIMDRQGTEYLDKPIPQALANGFDTVPVRVNHIPDEFYGKGEPEFLYSYQLEMSEKRTQMLNHTRRFNRKYQIPRDCTQDDVDSLVRGDDGTVVRTDKPIVPIADAPLSSDLYNEIEAIWKESQEVSGISAYQRGSSESGVYSATAAKIIDAASNVRVEFHRDRVKKAIERGSRILYKLLQGLYKWPQIEFNYNVDLSTMQRPDDEGRRQQLIQFASVAKEFPEFKRPAWLQDFSLAFMKPPQQYTYSPQEMQQMQQPDPNQQKAQMEMQIMQAQAQMDMQSKQADLQLKQQEAQLEIQMKRTEMQMSIMEMQEKFKLEQAKIALEREKMSMEMQAKREDAALATRERQETAAMAKHDMDNQKEQASMKTRQMQDTHRMKMQQMKGKKNA